MNQFALRRQNTIIRAPQDSWCADSVPYFGAIVTSRRTHEKKVGKVLGNGVAIKNPRGAGKGRYMEHSDAMCPHERTPVTVDESTARKTVVCILTALEGGDSLFVLVPRNPKS